MRARRHSLSRYLRPSADPFTHFKIVRGEVQPGFERLKCLLASAWADRVCELIALEPDAAGAAMKALLTEGRSVQFALRRRDGREQMSCPLHGHK